MTSHNIYTPERLSIAQEFSSLSQSIAFDVRLEDLNAPDGSAIRPGGSTPEQIRFSILVCDGSKVLAAAEPYRLGSDRKVLYLTDDAFQQLTELLPGLPIIPRRTESKASDADLFQQLEVASQTACAGWTHSLQPLTQEQFAYLRYRQLLILNTRCWWDDFCLDIDDPTLAECFVPNTLGFLLGLTEGYGPAPNPFDIMMMDYDHFTLCSPRTWEALRPSERDLQPAQALTLNQRLELAEAGLPSSPEVSAGMAGKMAEIPLRLFLLPLRMMESTFGGSFLHEAQFNEYLGGLSLPYRQAAEQIYKLLHDGDEAHRCAAEMMLRDLANVAGCQSPWRKEDPPPAGAPPQQNQPQLSIAIPMPHLPLLKQSLYTVLQGAGVLAGSLDPLLRLERSLALNLIEKAPPNVWRFEDLVHWALLFLADEQQRFENGAEDCRGWIFDILEELLIIPFCPLSALKL